MAPKIQTDSDIKNLEDSKKKSTQYQNESGSEHINKLMSIETWRITTRD